MTNDTNKNDLQKILEEIEKAGIETDNFLAEIDRRMAKTDLEYAKLLIKENIDTLKIAKKILSVEA